MSASCSPLFGITVGKGRVGGLRVINELLLTPLPGWLLHKGDPVTLCVCHAEWTVCHTVFLQS